MHVRHSFPSYLNRLLMIIDDILLFQDDLVPSCGIKVGEVLAVLDRIQSHRGMYLDVTMHRERMRGGLPTVPRTYVAPSGKTIRTRA